MRPPLVMLHGWASSPAVWQATARRMRAHEARHLVLPGHPGGISGLATCLDDWALALLDNCPPCFDLCGWSLGGLLALGIARLAPRRVRRLVLIGTSPCFSGRDDWAHGLDVAIVARFRAEFVNDADRVMARFHALQSLGDSRRRAVAAGLAQCAAAPVAPVGMAAGLQLLDDTDLRAALPSLDLPVRLLHGAEDALIPAGAAIAMNDALPQCRLTLLDDCGHAPLLSRPDDCAALMEGFLAEPDR
ncbi:MAG: alpha/beta fold hydrolase [Rhodocyclaceae bacterium]|nr:alpha/beta fold hydrolase [Rhodocyclaceae bacterium]